MHLYQYRVFLDSLENLELESNFTRCIKLSIAEPNFLIHFFIKSNNRRIAINDF